MAPRTVLETLRRAGSKSQTHPWNDAPGAPHEDLPTAALRTAAALVALVSVAGIVAGWMAERRGLARPLPGSSNVFFHLYVLHERPFLLGLCGFSLVVALWPARRSGAGVALDSAAPGRFLRPRVAAVALAVAILVFTAIGTSVFLHRLALSMDEFVASFQARIFSAGRIQAHLPREWWRFGFALTPVFVEYKRATHVWIETYLPVYAAIRALFLKIGVEHLTNAVLATFSLPVLAAIGRRLWPRRPQATILALVFLASSSQFLLMSMTAYAMPAHLLLNLVWLWLYVRKDRASWLLLPWVGILALGLHHPFPHALFAAPFLLRLLVRNRGRWLAYITAVYAVGISGWWSWLRYTQPYTDRAGFWTLFAFPGAPALKLQLMHAAILFSWQTPVVPLLLVAAAFGWRRLPPFGRDLFAGLAFTFVFYSFFPIGQGHGWGYRYLYGVLGNAVLLATFGFEMARERLWRPGALVALSVASSVALQIPVRAVEAERFVRPFARALDYVHTVPQPVLVVDPRIAWYAQDLVRNSPFLDNQPKVMNGGRLPPFRRQELEQQFPGGVRDLRPDELRRLGYPGVTASDRAAF